MKLSSNDLSPRKLHSRAFTWGLFGVLVGTFAVAACQNGDGAVEGEPQGTAESDVGAAGASSGSEFSRFLVDRKVLNRQVLGETPLLDLVKNSQVAYVFLPKGRAPQGDFTTYQKPRVVIAIDPAQPFQGPQEHRRWSPIFLGYSEGDATLEAISFNEAKGRFDFELVTNFKPGARPQLEAAPMEKCGTCHQGGLPIFSQDDWDDTSAPGLFVKPSTTPVHDALLAAHAPKASYLGLPLAVRSPRDKEFPGALRGAFHSASQFADRVSRGIVVHLQAKAWDDCKARGSEASVVACRKERAVGIVHSLGSQDSWWPTELKGLLAKQPIPGFLVANRVPNAKGELASSLSAEQDPKTRRKPLDLIEIPEGSYFDSQICQSLMEPWAMTAAHAKAVMKSLEALVDKAGKGQVWGREKVPFSEFLSACGDPGLDVVIPTDRPSAVPPKEDGSPAQARPEVPSSGTGNSTAATSGVAPGPRTPPNSGAPPAGAGAADPMGSTPASGLELLHRWCDRCHGSGNGFLAGKDENKVRTQVRRILPDILRRMQVADDDGDAMPPQGSKERKAMKGGGAAEWQKQIKLVEALGKSP